MAGCAQMAVIAADELLKCYKNVYEDITLYLFDKGRQILNEGRAVVLISQELVTFFHKILVYSGKVPNFDCLAAIKRCQEINEVAVCINEVGLHVMQISEILEKLNIFDKTEGMTLQIRMSTPHPHHKNNSSKWKSKFVQENYETTMNSIISARKLIQSGLVAISDSKLTLERLRTNFIEFIDFVNISISIENNGFQDSTSDLGMILCSLRSGRFTILSGLNIFKEVIRVHSRTSRVELTIISGSESSIPSSPFNLTAQFKCERHNAVISVRKPVKNLNVMRLAVNNSKWNQSANHPAPKSLRIQKKVQSLANRPKWKF